MKPGWRRSVLKELSYVVVLGAPVLLFFLIAMPRSNAVRCLRGLAQVHAGATPFHQAEALAGHFGGYAACIGDNCLFQFQNQWLHRLHLAPLTVFSILLRRQGLASDPGGGQVGAIDISLLVNGDAAAGGGGDIIASAQDFERTGADPGGAFQASITFGRNGQPGRTVVLLSPEAKPGQRARARAFNLACLTKFGGCRTSRDLLPQVWRGARHIDAVQNDAPAAPFSHGRIVLATSAQMR